MGLDNGISIEYYDPKMLNIVPADWVERFDDHMFIEICYMRKCWGIRDELVGYLNEQYPEDADRGAWQLNLADIDAFITIYESWLDEERWEEYGESIWSWEEYQDRMRKYVSDLYCLQDLMQEFPDELVPSFYDSY